MSEGGILAKIMGKKAAQLSSRKCSPYNVTSRKIFWRPDKIWWENCLKRRSSWSWQRVAGEAMSATCVCVAMKQMLWVSGSLPQLSQKRDIATAMSGLKTCTSTSIYHHFGLLNRCLLPGRTGRAGESNIKRWLANKFQTVQTLVVHVCLERLCPFNHLHVYFYIKLISFALVKPISGTLLRKQSITAGEVTQVIRWGPVSLNVLKETVSNQQFLTATAQWVESAVCPFSFARVSC